MVTKKCGCVYADRSNTASVRSGHEVGGYLKTPCIEHASREPAAPEVQRYSADDCVSAANWLRFAANACAMVPDDAAETLPFVTDDCPYATAIPGISGDVYDNLMQFADLIAALQARIAELETEIRAKDRAGQMALDKLAELSEQLKAAEARNAASERDAVLVPREATSKMMDRAVAAMHAAPVDWRGRQGHAAFRAGYAAALDAAIDAHAQGQAGEEKDG